MKFFYVFLLFIYLSLYIKGIEGNIPDQVVQPRGIESINGSSVNMGCTSPFGRLDGVIVCMSQSYLLDGCSPAIDTSVSEWASQLVTVRKTQTDEIPFDHVVLTFAFDEVVSLHTIEIDLFLCPQWGIGAPFISVYANVESNLVFTGNSLSTLPFAHYTPSQSSCGSLSKVTIILRDSLTSSSYLTWHILVSSFTPFIDWVHVGEVRFLGTDIPNPGPTPCTVPTPLPTGLMSSVMLTPTPTGCRDDQFQCLDGYCIPDYYICDGYEDCEDGSDEHIANCSGCRDDEFQCLDGYCIPDYYVCDGYNDCVDGSDEHFANCPEPCREGQFQCPEDSGSSLCYPLKYLCDSYQDCKSGYDEQNCSTIEFTSPLSIYEGTVDTLQFCFTVTEVLEKHIRRHYYIHLPKSQCDLEYFFHNNTIIFNGNYYAGESECVAMDVSVPDDNVVKGIKEIETEISGICISIFIIDNDYLRIGFQETLYTVSESDGVLEITVGPAVDDDPVDIGIPLGFRITSSDGLAVAGVDYEGVLTTHYFRPGHDPVVVIQINIIDDSIQEGDEYFSVELTAYDISTVLRNSIVEVLILDDEEMLEECTVELDGPIAVTGNSATYSFHGVGTGITGFICKLNGVQLPDCSRSSVLTDLAPGNHRLRVVPVGCAVNQGQTFRFDV